MYCSWSRKATHDLRKIPLAFKTKRNSNSVSIETKTPREVNTELRGGICSVMVVNNQILPMKAVAFVCLN
jgi:hypothetical protein